jgi:hypothetical protein
MSEKGNWQVDDAVFECGIGVYELANGRKEWFWRAKGPYLEKFCQTHESDWLPLDADDSLGLGPFKTKQAAERALEEFKREFRDFLETEFPDLEINDAPDPRSLS